MELRCGLYQGEDLGQLVSLPWNKYKKKTFIEISNFFVSKWWLVASKDCLVSNQLVFYLSLSYNTHKSHTNTLKDHVPKMTFFIPLPPVLPIPESAVVVIVFLSLSFYSYLSILLCFVLSLFLCFGFYFVGGKSEEGMKSVCYGDEVYNIFVDTV